MTDIKEQVGRAAAQYVEDGMVVGLGTGSTAFWFVDEIGRRVQSGELSHIVGIPTSKRTEEQARMLKIPLKTLDEVAQIDVLVDGADECTPTFNGIKGGGGALLHEKIVAQSSNKRIWIVGEDKVVDTLGAFPLPVEVIPFGSWKLFRTLGQAGFNPTFRKKNQDSLFVTDSGNYIIDLHLKEIINPAQLAHELNNTVGVVEHGLFLNHPHIILVGQADGTIKRYER
ncbi:ribose-5-phosphate isomerase RpiA [Aerococcaceae bacterium NML191292]|nr:ribose-5-phosphate isomerase RpiA [Aerococcaceae bacterium NML210727]MCW6654704.1 ribose-5-phosphate isomerase RpiA [Aerococcaceae bacterium NML201296]MCW6658952.1 ribose-5-phosphate isomerase RpiA [Aerococcaceae bacterium NML191292]MCW6660713.1 ribose-5-phosphate isomerase RpiA [Aerococcaceae bacterium NML201209]MCW6662284.1 ribose-5-phosphate isomerase RpiA [Aerococcaceae bacterium NML190073]MCW6666717.1 ribose-5-phosphate isomerase RpiA [Aerococcaceae bacterium NML190938]MCW6675089.1 ri